MIKEIKGDLLKLAIEGKFNYIVHGCNCFHTMGSGIAAQMSRILPLSEERDKDATSYGDINKLGDYTIAYIREGIPTKLGVVQKGFYVINLYTQYRPGNNFSLPALQVGLLKLSDKLPTNVAIGFPWIGAGIGGGNWKEIKSNIEALLGVTHDVTLVEYAT